MNRQMHQDKYYQRGKTKLKINITCWKRTFWQSILWVKKKKEWTVSKTKKPYSYKIDFSKWKRAKSTLILYFCNIKLLTLQANFPTVSKLNVFTQDSLVWIIGGRYWLACFTAPGSAQIQMTSHNLRFLQVKGVK